MSDVLFPLSTNSLGNFEIAGSYSDMWRQRVLSVLSTPEGSRVMRPRFGSRPQAAMFENYDSADAVVKGMVGSAFSSWLPDLSLEKVIVKSNPEDSSLVVDIWYALPNGAVDTVTTSASASLYGFGAS